MSTEGNRIDFRVRIHGALFRNAMLRAGSNRALQHVMIRALNRYANFDDTDSDVPTPEELPSWANEDTLEPGGANKSD